MQMHRNVKDCKAHHGTFTLHDVLFQETWPCAFTGNTAKDHKSTREKRRFTLWTLPCSLAVTKGIIVIFFSSA